VELDWSTFALEILNFLILVWILKRFLYRPVLGAIGQRQARIREALADAKAVEEKALALQSRYENRLAEWEREREAARVGLAKEIAAERERLLNALAASLEQEREKRRVVEERSQREWQRAAEERAIDQARRFLAKLLVRLASPELEGRLVDLALDDLRQLAGEQARALTEAAAAPAARIAVASAYPLDGERRERLARALAGLTGRELPAEFGEQKELVSGLLVTVGPWMLRANLRDELEFFAGVANHAP
jgi:F-type H+-transporting ATPase subunit b